MLRGTTLLPGFHPGALMRNVHIRHILPPSSSDYLPGKIVDPRKQKTTLRSSNMQLRCEIQRLPFPKGLPANDPLSLWAVTNAYCAPSLPFQFLMALILSRRKKKCKDFFQIKTTP